MISLWQLRPHRLAVIMNAQFQVRRVFAKLQNKDNTPCQPMSSRGLSRPTCNPAASYICRMKKQLRHGKKQEYMQIKAKLLQQKNEDTIATSVSADLSFQWLSYSSRQFIYHHNGFGSDSCWGSETFRNKMEFSRPAICFNGLTVFVFYWLSAHQSAITTRFIMPDHLWMACILSLTCKTFIMIPCQKNSVCTWMRAQFTVFSLLLLTPAVLLRRVL